MLYAVLLMPTVILILCLSIDVAQMQMQRLRLRYAVEMATVSGASSIDTAYYRANGRLQLDPGVAMMVTRAYLMRNLEPALGTNQAESVAADAEITVTNIVPGLDPYSGQRLDRPSVSVRIRAPYRLSLLGFLGTLGSGRLTASGTGAIRQ
jgi:hypothetical protein